MEDWSFVQKSKDHCEMEKKSQISHDGSIWTCVLNWWSWEEDDDENLNKLHSETCEIIGRWLDLNTICSETREVYKGNMTIRFWICYILNLMKLLSEKCWSDFDCDMFCN